MDYDSALEAYLGTWGPYYWRALATFLTLGTPTTAVLTESVFQAAEPPYVCTDPGVGPAPKAQCKVTDVNGTNITADSPFTDCTQWDFDTDKYGPTVITQWSLVCSQSWVPGAAQSAVMAGLMVGVFFSGILSDRFGRRPVCLAGLLLTLGVRIAAIFCPNYACYITTKFLMAAFIISFYTPAYIDCMECVVPKHRFLFAVIMQSSIGVTYAVMAGIAYAVKDWFHITIIYSIFILPYSSYIILMSESPRWLLSKGRQDKAHSILKQMVKTNGGNLPEHVKLENPMHKTSADYGFLDFCKSPVLLMYLVVNIYIWNIDVLLYYSLTLNAVTLFGDLYLNAAAMGLVEIPAFPAAHVLSNSRLGRRGTQALCFMVAGGAVMAAHFVPKGTTWLQLSLYLLSKLAITTAFTVTYIFTPELFPTSLRNRALGICSQMGRIGSILGPFIGRLGAIWPPFPSVLIGSAAVGAGLLTLLLPETRGRHLPQTIEDSALLRKRVPTIPAPSHQTTHDRMPKQSEPDSIKQSTKV